MLKEMCLFLSRPGFIVTSKSWINEIFACAIHQEAKRVVVLRLHDTVESFPTGIKFSPRCKNRGELTPVLVTHSDSM